MKNAYYPQHTQRHIEAHAEPNFQLTSRSTLFYFLKHKVKFSRKKFCENIRITISHSKI